jgi:hypothetical protein
MKQPRKPTTINLEQRTANVVQFELDESRLSELIAGRGEILPSLPNTLDNLAVHQFSSASIGSLPVDHFGQLLCKPGETFGDKHIVGLRLSLIKVYFQAAYVRRYARATRNQIRSARAALASLTNAIEQLEDVSPPRLRGLQGMLGSPLDDAKGLSESNEFHAKCWQIKLDIPAIAMRLERAIEIETRKPKAAKSGERKKRLRTLVEMLAEWWRSVTGKSLAPYVHAKRLDHRPAIVIGRRGKFVALALAVFSKLDDFSDSEVISAVTNVHESDLAKRKSKTKAKQ